MLHEHSVCIALAISVWCAWKTREYKIEKVPWSATTLRHTPRHTPHIIFNRPSMVPAVNISTVRVSRMQLSYHKRSTEEGRVIKYPTDTDALTLLRKPKGL